MSTRIILRTCQIETGVSIQLEGPRKPMFAGSDDSMQGVRVFFPPGHFYSPITDPSIVAAHLDRIAGRRESREVPGIDIDFDMMQATWNDLLPYLQTVPFLAESQEGYRYRFKNPAYSYGDGSILHAMIRRHQPKRLIEIGSGWSSACTLDTIEHFLPGGCEVTFIEPYPETLLGVVGEEEARRLTILSHRVQETPLAMFDELEANDILFIDSTHVLATGSDVCFELFEILPRLRPGVLVHFHDVFWPFEYPRAWSVDENRSWNELQALRAFLTDNEKWRIVFFNDYFVSHQRELIARTYPTYLANSGGALWITKV